MPTEKEFKLIEKRLEAWNEKINISSISLGKFTKEEMLKHVKQKDEVGEGLVNIQLNYLKKFKK